MDAKILLKLLEDQADPAKVPHMEAYMKNKLRFLGVQKTILRKIEREFFKSFIKDPIDWNFVEECWQQPYREFQYIAMDYLDILLWIIWTKRRRSLDLKIFQS